jgi:hypothetical protein
LRLMRVSYDDFRCELAYSPAMIVVSCCAAMTCRIQRQGGGFPNCPAVLVTFIPRNFSPKKHPGKTGVLCGELCVSVLQIRGKLPV